MEKSAFSSLSQVGVTSAEPDIVEVTLRDKCSRPRASAASRFKSGAVCGHSERKAAADSTNATSQLFCERCRAPSRLWLHHTCRAVKSAGANGSNARTPALKLRTSKRIHATGKSLPRERVASFCPSAAMSPSPSGTVGPIYPGTQKCCASGSSASWEDDSRSGFPINEAESPGIPEDAGGASSSLYSLRSARASHQDVVRRPARHVNASGQLVPTALAAKQIAQGERSASGQRGEAQTGPASAPSFVRSDESAESIPTVRHARPIRPCDCTAIEAVQDSSEERQPISGQTSDYESRSQSVADVVIPEWNSRVARNHPVCRRNVVDPCARGTVERKRHCKAVVQRGQCTWNVWEAEDDAVYVNTPMHSFKAVDLARIAPTGQAEVSLSKEQRRETFWRHRGPISEDRKTECLEESFASRKYSGDFSASDLDTHECAAGGESLSNNSCGHTAGEFERESTSGVRGGVLAGSCRSDDLRSSQTEHLETRRSAFVGDSVRNEQRESRGVTPFPAEPPATASGRARLGRSVVQKHSGPVSGAVNDGTGNEHSASCIFGKEMTSAGCVCERVGHFLDSLECFLQEPDPQLRRERLSRIHATFLSIRAG